MSNKFIDQFLNYPDYYKLVTNLLAPGYERVFVENVRSVRAQFPQNERVLDIGCGPQSWLWKAGAHTVGLDITYSYCLAMKGQAEQAIMGSAAGLPIADESFGEVWSIGMFHHLPDQIARNALDEMLRVCKPGGNVVIFDAVLPIRAWQRPLAYAIRRADRGRFVRSQNVFEAMLPQRSRWSVKRLSISLTGLEIVSCRFLKEN